MGKILLCSTDMPSCVTDILENLSYQIIKIPKCRSLSHEVASHPDMIFSVLGERHLITDKNYFESNGDFFDVLAEKGVRISVSEMVLAAKYPSDILFDAIKNDRLLIGNLKYTAPELFSEKAVTVNVKQGYALCSTLLMKGAAVCADEGICNALRENGYDVLQISAGNIALDGYGYGFIGGASAALEDEKAIVFFGDIFGHPEGKEIVDFCEKHGYKTLYTAKTPLTDLGGVKVI